MGLKQIMGVEDAATCELDCCANGCYTWQFKPSDGCWQSMDEMYLPPSCSKSNGWKGGSIKKPQVVRPNIKAPITLNYNDTNWRTLNVPHDFVVEGTFSENAVASHGFLPTNISWYRKEFTVDTSWENSVT
eukprot:UN10929